MEEEHSFLVKDDGAEEILEGIISLASVIFFGFLVALGVNQLFGLTKKREHLSLAQGSLVALIIILANGVWDYLFPKFLKVR